MEDYNLDATYTAFKYLYAKGRATTKHSFVEEHYYTTDKKNISYFNFYPNAHPEFILEAYQFGLLKMVYPSNNLLELSRFPKEFREAFKTYKKKCLKVFDISYEDKLKVNLVTPYCLMTSFSSSTISEEDYAKVHELKNN
ncbi:hypothetical protein L6452_44381 [Arctium lappa]|uniref:Uncharacterized protein n=1 Tax=Arctium lappa TaxID=4217 RepID=A0ACB8XFR1_ARCLA|nr:hypothetical protein L6452_44381 [Arctium lappa]